jgi:hypothetical protein
MITNAFRRTEMKKNRRARTPSAGGRCVNAAARTSSGIALGKLSACEADRVQRDQTEKAEGSVLLGSGQTLERVDDDFVRCGTGVEAGNAHQARDLTSNNVDRRASHEARYS